MARVFRCKTELSFHRHALTPQCVTDPVHVADAHAAAFAQLAKETQAFEVLGPPLADTDPQ